jgi:hypothetical protein
VRRALVRTIAAVALIIAPLAALSQPRRAAAIPTLKGTLLIQWDGESRFIYLPDPNNPLTFLTRDGRTIVPARMYTDGGSVPRVFWGAKGFSPWGYGPAYILHDWLFHRHRCGEDTGPDRYSMAQANQVLDDAIEYLMRTGKVSRNNQARHLITWDGLERGLRGAAAGAARFPGRPSHRSRRHGGADHLRVSAPFGIMR